MESIVGVPPPLDIQATFLRLFTANEAAVRAFVRSLVPGLSDSNDVMQEVAVVLWQKFEEYDPEQSFRGWAFGIAKMKVLSWRRDRGRDRHIFGDAVTDLLADYGQKHSDRLEAQREALRQCLEKLSEKQRQIIDSAYAPGSKIAELATAFGNSLAAHYKTLHRIRMALIDCTRRELAKESAR